METDRGEALREAIMAVRKGGTLSILASTESWISSLSA